MKKILCFVLSLVFVFCFASCDSPEEDVHRITIDEFKEKMEEHSKDFRINENSSGVDFSYSIIVPDVWEKKTLTIEGKANENREIETITMKLSVKDSDGTSAPSSNTIDYVQNVSKDDWAIDLLDMGSVRGYEMPGYVFILHTILLESVLFDTFTEHLTNAQVIELSESFFSYRNKTLTRNHWDCTVDLDGDMPTFSAKFKR